MQKHLRNTFLAGIFAAIPVGVTVFLIWYVENVTHRALFSITGLNVPFVGIPLAILAVYALGLIVTSLIGRFILRTLDRLLSRLPFLKDLYQAWKQVTLTPGGGEGMYSKVVLIPTGTGDSRLIGFTSGDPVPGDERTCCVFVPNSPNPVMGRIYFVARDRCLTLGISVEEAFKLILSSGNYVPDAVGAATGEVIASRVAPPLS